MTARIDELAALLEEAGGGLRPYDPRLEPFEKDGSLQAALAARRVVQTPSTIELPSEVAAGKPVADIMMGLVALVVCLLVVGESLNWWNLLKDNPRRGDWHIKPLDASREPFDRPDVMPVP